MKLSSIFAENIPPIVKFEIQDLGNIAIIAGANGSGKTILKKAIVETFKDPTSPKLNLKIESTRPEESEKWGQKTIETVRDTGSPILHSYMSTRARGGTYVGSVIQIDSERTITSVKFEPLLLTTPDPDDVEIESTFYLNPFQGRWQQIVNKIFQKAAARAHKILASIMSDPDSKGSAFLEKYPDSFLSYQKLFTELLPDKELLPIDPKIPGEFKYKQKKDDKILAFSSLSSGEQEVVKISFDILSKKMRHCIFLIDEPELHLHPTLTFRLIETLKKLGGATNQFIFFTHSADLISTYYSTGDVYFVDTNKDGSNQAHKLSELNKKHQSLVRVMSENLGLFAVGKKLIFVEGKEASRDRLSYHAIAQEVFPEANIIPAGSVENLMLLNKLASDIQNAIFGIDFFMIRDRDGLTDKQVTKLEKSERIRCLKRRHLENYFLDSEILAKIAKNFYLDSELQNESNIEKHLSRIAQRALNAALVLSMKEFIRVNGTMDSPKVSGLDRKTVNDVQKELSSLSRQACNKFNEEINQTSIDEFIETEKNKLTKSLQNGTWKEIFPGKFIFNVLCGEVLNVQADKIRQAYIDIALNEKPEALEDIIEILKTFKG